MDALTHIGNFLGSTGGKALLGIGTAGGGLIQNVLANRQANQKQKFVQDLITNPAKFNALVAQTEQPLSQGLTTDVARQADAYGAERGLGSSPAVMKDVFAQALAPYQQTEQQMAINSLLSRLGIYAQQPTMAPVNMSSIFKALAMGNTPYTGSTSATPSGNWDPLAMGGPNTLPTPSVDFSTGDFGSTTTLPDFGSSNISFG